jgi:hypothetical protein
MPLTRCSRTLHHREWLWWLFLGRNGDKDRNRLRSLIPPKHCCLSGNLRTTLGSEGGGSGFATFGAPKLTPRLGLACLLSSETVSSASPVANVHDQLGELVRGGAEGERCNAERCVRTSNRDATRGWIHAGNSGVELKYPGYGARFRSHKLELPPTNTVVRVQHHCAS